MLKDYKIDLHGKSETLQSVNDYYASIKTMEFLENLANNHPLVIEYRKNPSLYCKITASPNGSIYQQEIFFYDKLKSEYFIPELIHFQHLFECKLYTNKNEFIDTFIISMIVTKNRGLSISEIYFNNKKFGPGTTSKYILVNPLCFQKWFPPDIIPKYITDQIIDICSKLSILGLSHDDIHPGNFVIDEDVVTLIDLAFMSNISNNINMQETVINII